MRYPRYFGLTPVVSRRFFGFCTVPIVYCTVHPGKFIERLTDGLIVSLGKKIFHTLTNNFVLLSNFRYRLLHENISENINRGI